MSQFPSYTSNPFRRGMRLRGEEFLAACVSTWDEGVVADRIYDSPDIRVERTATGQQLYLVPKPAAAAGAGAAALVLAEIDGTADDPTTFYWHAVDDSGVNSASDGWGVAWDINGRRDVKPGQWVYISKNTIDGDDAFTFDLTHGVDLFTDEAPFVVAPGGFVGADGQSWWVQEQPAGFGGPQVFVANDIYGGDATTPEDPASLPQLFGSFLRYDVNGNLTRVTGSDAGVAFGELKTFVTTFSASGVAGIVNVGTTPAFVLSAGDETVEAIDFSGLLGADRHVAVWDDTGNGAEDSAPGPLFTKLVNVTPWIDFKIEMQIEGGGWVDWDFSTTANLRLKASHTPWRFALDTGEEAQDQLDSSGDLWVNAVGSHPHVEFDGAGHMFGTISAIEYAHADWGQVGMTATDSIKVGAGDHWILINGQSDQAIYPTMVAYDRKGHLNDYNGQWVWKHNAPDYGHTAWTVTFDAGGGTTYTVTFDAAGHYNKNEDITIPIGAGGTPDTYKVKADEDDPEPFFLWKNAAEGSEGCAVGGSKPGRAWKIIGDGQDDPTGGWICFALATDGDGTTRPEHYLQGVHVGPVVESVEHPHVHLKIIDPDDPGVPLLDIDADYRGHVFNGEDATLTAVWATNIVDRRYDTASHSWQYKTEKQLVLKTKDRSDWITERTAPSIENVRNVFWDTDAIKQTKATDYVVEAGTTGDSTVVDFADCNG